jgi:hypothetical protein
MPRQRSNTGTKYGDRRFIENPGGSQGQNLTSLPLVVSLTEARKSFRYDEIRSGAPASDAVRTGMPSLSGACGSITIAVVDHTDDVAWDYHRSSGNKWRCDEGDRCSGEQGYCPARRTGVNAYASECQYARSALDRVRAPTGSPRGAELVRTNSRGASSEALLSLQEIVA